MFQRRWHSAIATAATIAGALVLLGVIVAAPALAHVTASAPGATQGGYATVTFKVPTESATANTIGLRVAMPADAPTASVSIQPKAGWTYSVIKGKPAIPHMSDDGQVTEVVTEVSWQAAPGNVGIKPGEFDQFVISAGPMPDVPTITFKAIQSYSDGSKVSWIDTPAAGSDVALDHPAPSITLAAANTTDAVAIPPSSGDGGLSTLSVVALVIGVIGFVFGALALLGLFTVRKNLSKGSLTP
ncbi:YcnI family copper-binding membrane protein [Jatrophihabitans sp. DSM 45814]